MPELKPCPFCGCSGMDLSREIINVEIIGDATYKNQNVIYCWGCGACAMESKWNKRTQ